MCSQEETGLKRWVLGSVTQQAVRNSPVPVLVLNEQGTVPAALKTRTQQPVRILITLDGSPLAKTAIEPAARLLAILAALHKEHYTC